MQKTELTKNKTHKDLNIKNTKGITLIALVITIIVILILAGVSINMLFGDNGLLTKAQEAADANTKAGAQDKVATEVLASYDNDGKLNAQTLVENLKARGFEVTDGGKSKENFPVTVTVDGYTFTIGSSGNPLTIESIVSEENQVGSYADVNGDGTPDGIIYADLKAGMRGDENWTNSSDNYTIPKESNVKDYCIIKNEYNGKFGNKPVIALKGGTGEERFYVMALEDLDSNYHYWYYNAYGKMSDYSSTTSEDFGRGKQNTETMIKKYEDKAYGDPYTTGTYTDLWGLSLLKQKVSEGWFVPSKEEWAAFGGEIAEIVGITDDDDNYGDFGLSAYYWSSSQEGTNYAWDSYFTGCFMGFYKVDGYNSVRLSATF